VACQAGDAKTLTDYAVLAPHNVLVGLLAHQADHKKSLESAARRWAQRFGGARPLAIRLAAAGTIHDRLIVVDRATVWGLGQPFSALTKRARTSLVRTPASRRSHDCSVCGGVEGGAAVPGVSVPFSGEP
jgi:hypothetical protein